MKYRKSQRLHIREFFACVKFGVLQPDSSPAATVTAAHYNVQV